MSIDVVLYLLLIVFFVGDKSEKMGKKENN